MIHTIKGRIIIVFAVCIGLVGLLTGVYSWDIYSLENKLVTIEQFHDLFDHILEVRRYEKNFMYLREARSLKEMVYHLNKTQDDVTRLSGSIIKVIGHGKFRQFEEDLVRYKTIIERNLGKDPQVDMGEMRAIGTSMVDFGQELLEHKRKRINYALKRIRYLPIASMMGFLVLVILIFQSQAKNVIDRLAFIQKAIDEVAKGNFAPISDLGKRKDEVSDLMATFNKMAKELDSRWEQLVESRKLAAIGTFSSGIAHELNNPLNNISLTADSLLGESESLSVGEVKEMILDIINETDRASQVVKNLLDFSRTEPPLFRKLELKEVIERTYKLIKNQLMLEGVELFYDAPDNLPPIKGNLHNLEQVFLNLFLNAIEAMPKGGLITLQAKEERDGYIGVKVCDTGGGITPEDLEKIFDPFYTTKPVGRGTGLGLSIVYGIVKKHGGYVEVKSELNEGTTFTIYLPLFHEGESRGEAHAGNDHR